MGGLNAILISSGRHLAEAQDLQVALNDDGLDVFVWDHRQLPARTYVIDALIERGDKSDCAVVLATAEDIKEMRDKPIHVPRDDVIFEAGLFAGILGRERVFLVYPTEHAADLPTDLQGLTPAPYATGGHATIQASGQLIAKMTKKLGQCSRSQLLQLDGHPNQKEIIEIAAHSVAGGLRSFQPFDFEIRRRMSVWLAESGHWLGGKIVSRVHYWRLLADVYEKANANIFSTCIRSFVHGLAAAHGRAVLEAQAQNHKATSTRLFIFGSLKNVTDLEISQVKENIHLGIEVLILIADETDGDIAPTVINDWVIVDDGLVIGVTRQIGDVYEAEWYYDDATKREEMLRLRGQFRDASYVVVREATAQGWSLSLRDSQEERPAIKLNW